MPWIIPVLLWFGLVLLAINRDVSRVSTHLEYTYEYSDQIARKLAILISSLIYLPPFAFLMLAWGLGETHLIGVIGASCLCIVAPVWWYLGYVMTGGSIKNS